MYVITVWIIVFAVTVFSKSENRKTDTTAFIFGFGSFVNNHNQISNETRKVLQRNLLTIISSSPNRNLYTYEKIAEPSILLFERLSAKRFKCFDLT